jgi:multiple sugar transport system substrate-binding protein
MASEPKKVDRRKFLYAGLGVVALIAIGAATYVAMNPPVVTQTVPTTSVVTTTSVVPTTSVVTTTSVVPTTSVVTTTVSTVPATVSERAINGARVLVASGKVPKGATIRILHVAGSRAQIEAAIPSWESATGTKVELVTVGTEGDVYTKAMQEAVTKSGAYDAITIFSTWNGDLIEAGLARPLDDFYEKYDPGYGSNAPCSPIEPLASYVTKYKGKRYTVDLDADVYTLTYRKDLFENSEYQNGFKKQYGYDLKPPETWDQVLDIAKFFTELKLKAPTGAPFYGAYFYAEPRFAAYTTWITIFTSLGGILWDTKTMDAKVDSKEGLDALNKMIKLIPYMPPSALTAGWADLYDRYAKGEVAMAMAWPSMIKEAERPEAFTKGKNGVSLVPGSYVDVGGTRKLIRAAPNPVNWVGIVSNYAKYPELAYLFLQYMTSPEIGPTVILSGTILDPFRQCWFHGSYRDVMEAGYTPEFLDAFEESIAHSFPDIVIRGGGEYTGKLTENVNAAMTGTKDPEKALSDTASEWDKITDKYGRSDQLTAWQALVNLFPDDVKEVWKAKGYL